MNFFVSDEVLFDIDLREIVDHVALDAIYEVVALLGASLGKPVTVSHRATSTMWLIGTSPAPMSYRW